MAKFQLGVKLNPYNINDTARVDDSTGSQPLAKEDNGKFVKFKGDSRYGLCAAGDKIEGVLQVADDLVASFDGYKLGSIGGKDKGSRVAVVCDGLEATPGTGAIAIGDYVVCGTVVARGTSLSGAAPKVCKATNQPGTTIVSTLAGADTAAAVKTVLDEALVKVADSQANAQFGWKVVAITSGTGAVGDKAVIERV